jgi:hypothetical protein
MLEQSPATGVFSFAELNYLRMEAMDLFERCLTEGHPVIFEVFVEQQISQEPPRVELLREVAEDLHQRLLSLREHHFEVRNQVLRRLREDYSVDLSEFIPLSALHTYHLINPDEALYFMRQQQSTLSEQQEHVVRKTLDASIGMAAQLSRDVAMTEHLYEYVMDWVMGLHATQAQRFWADARFEKSNERIH